MGREGETVDGNNIIDSAFIRQDILDDTARPMRIL
jgi:hypothetical protein